MDYDDVSRLLSFVPNDALESLALETRVNKFSKKLRGELLFKLLLYCLVTEKENSLRGMQCALESTLFQAFNNTQTPEAIAHSSLSERLNIINYQYFEKIFQHCVSTYKASSTIVCKAIVRFDSTIVSLSSKLLKVGYNLKGGDADKYRLLKFTIGYSDVPDCICFYSGQTYNSENVALTETIVSNHHNKSQINVFDRGITSRANYDILTDRDILFVSGIDPNAKHTIYGDNTLKEPVVTETLTILSDSWVYLYTMNGKRSKHAVRVIKAAKKSDGEAIAFITNIGDLLAGEVTDIYKSRWKIEVFFKFIKQHLNFSHLLNRTENGIKVVMYVTMIAAILLTQYKTEKGLKGYKIVKKRFAQELEKNIIYNIVLLCGGSEEKARKIIFKNTT